MADLHDFQKLEQALIDSGRAIEYPRTPDLTARVRAQLNPDRSRPPDRPAGRLRPLFIVALAMLAAIALLLIIPETREAIAQLLGLRTIRLIETAPTPLRPTSTPGVVPFKQCCASTLAETQQQARFPLRLPPDEQPARVFFQDHIFGRGSEPQQVVLVFGDPDRPRVVLYEASRMLYEKLLPRGSSEAGTVITETQVNGVRALWLTGAPHVLVTLDRRGEPVFGFERPVNANTLIWETGDLDRGVTYRLETMLGLTEAIEFAESLR
jgi:hypothetical protein